MPTIPKLFAGILFAALAYLVGDLIKPLLPEGTRTGLLNETLAFIGFWSGWTVSGKRAGQGVRAGLGYGLTSSGMIIFWGVFVFAGQKALQNSLDRRYKGPIEAIQAMIRIGIDYVVQFSTVEILGTLVIGGLFAGWLAEWIAKRWN